MNKRSAMLERELVDVENRTITVAFSSEDPVEMGGYKEILSHQPGHMRTERLDTGGAVLVNHDWDDQVGVIESYSIDSMTGIARAVLRFGKSERANEIFQDVLDEIRRHISVAISPMPMR
ncbi:phage protein [Vibrio ishigakensis]|uniref:Phage protein n=1 Tax=Vibrio ishigakensis TaxID=1481914 RepID=A0A0B8PKL7_9VIBR|nr:phage protein [Vibrio ishigakensis]